MPGAAWPGDFIGTGELGPNPADPTGSTRILMGDLHYSDSGDMVKAGDPGNITDGASPVELQGLIGQPFTLEFIKAAVIHDHYCDKVQQNRVRSWQSTHRVFYEMLRDSGVPFGSNRSSCYPVSIRSGRSGAFSIRAIFPACDCINKNVEPRYFAKNEYSFFAAGTGEYDGVMGLLESNPDVDLSVLEELAKARHPNDNSFRFTQFPANANPQ